MNKGEAQSTMATDHNARIDFLNKELKLSPEQKESVSNIMTEYRDKILDEKNKLIDDMVDAVNDSDAKIKAVLTAEQAKKYESLKEQQHQSLSDRMKEWFQGGMCY
jgi:Spy/CpxP family protein refolding chaperone